ncbi:hypothetical protein Bca101_045777 [Brassica carinata]
MVIQESELLELSEIYDSLCTMLFQGVLDNEDVEVLQATGIHTFKGLKMHLMNNPGGINGLSHAKVDIICEEADNILALRKAEANRTKTAHIIARKEFLQTYLKNKKRIEQLKISIALNAKGEGQLNHWKTELITCQTRVANMENNN